MKYFINIGQVKNIVQRYEIRANSNIFYNKLNSIYNSTHRKFHIKKKIKDKSLPSINFNQSTYMQKTQNENSIKFNEINDGIKPYIIKKNKEYDNKKIIKIQKYFREHRSKKKLYIGLEEPKCILRIYEDEYDSNNNIKSIEINIYSIFFQKNVKVIKTIEELFDENSMPKEKILKKVPIIFNKVMEIKKPKQYNNDYFDKSKADLSSEDFDDFEDN